MPSTAALQAILKQLDPGYYTQGRVETLSDNDMLFALKLLGAEDSLALLGSTAGAPVLITKVRGEASPRDVLDVEDFDPSGGAPVEVNVKDFGAVGNGVADDTAAIVAAMTPVVAGSTIMFPRGVYKTDPIVVTKKLHFRGEGMFDSVLRARTDFSGALLDFDVAPGAGPLFDLGYGPSVRSMALDVSTAPTGIGLRDSEDTGWLLAQDIVINGGNRSIEHHGSNARFDHMILIDADECFVFVDDIGLEVQFTRITMTRVAAGSMDAYMKVILASNGQKGDLRLEGVSCGANIAGGVVMNSGFIITAPSLTNLPVFAHKVVIDNVSNGAGLVLTNIESVDFSGGWINSAGAPGGPCVRITGGGDIAFRGNKYRGGGVVPSTYDFVGGSTRGFTSKDNYCPTGPVYYLPVENGPTDMNVDDDVPGAVLIAQVTNDPAQLRSATRRLWGFDRRAGRAEIAQEAVRVVGAVGEPAFQNSWVAMASSLLMFWKDSLGVVHLAGRVQDGTALLVFTLPVGYRPLIQEQFGVQSGVTVGDVIVSTTGTVQISMPYPATVISLSGITFQGVQ